MNSFQAELDSIAREYHLSSEVQDKYIEEECQIFAVSEIKKILSLDDEILELGLGDGVTTNILSAIFKKYSVVEGTQLLYEHGLSSFPHVNFIHSFFENYTPHQRYDKVLALHVFEHVDEPIQVMNQMRSWIEDDGELVIIVPNSESIHRRIALEAGMIGSLDDLSPRDMKVGHQRVYSLAMLNEHLASAGYKVTESKGLFFKPFSNNQLLNLDINIIRAMNSISLKFPTEYAANLLVRAKLS